MPGMLSLTLPAVAEVHSKRGIGWAIRKVRKAQEKTLNELALAVGSDPGNLSRVERGVQEVPQGTLLAIAAELNVTVSDLWKLAEGGDPDESGRMLALTGMLTPAQRRRLLEYGEFLLDRQSD